MSLLPRNLTATLPRSCHRRVVPPSDGYSVFEVPSPTKKPGTQPHQTRRGLALASHEFDMAMYPAESPEMVACSMLVKFWKSFRFSFHTRITQSGVICLIRYSVLASPAGEYYRLVQMFCFFKYKIEKKGQKMDLDYNSAPSPFYRMHYRIRINDDSILNPSRSTRNTALPRPSISLHGSY